MLAAHKPSLKNYHRRYYPQAFKLQDTGITLMEPLMLTKTYGGNINIQKIGRQAL